LLNLFEKLAGLQNLDLTILNQKKKILKKNEEINKIQQQIEWEKLEWEKFRKLNEKERIDLSRLELELQDIEEKLKKSQNRLYSGDVQSGKELSQWKSSMENFEKTKSHLEDQIIAQIEKFEGMLIKEREKESRLRMQHSVNSIEQLKNEIMKHETDLTQNHCHRSDSIQELPTEVYALYEDLRKKYSNPVVEMDGDTCRGCHLSLPSTTAKSVRKKETLIQCPNCYRMIFCR